MLETKFYAPVQRDTLWLELALCRFQPIWTRVSMTLVFLADGRNLILVANSLIFVLLKLLMMLLILSNADYITEVKPLAIVFWHSIFYIPACRRG